MKNVNIIHVGGKLEVTFDDNGNNRTFVFESLNEDLGFGITPSVMIRSFLAETEAMEERFNIIASALMHCERI